MTIDINKNIDKVNDKFFTGKKRYQIICLILGFGIAVAVMFFLRKYISSASVSYICMFICSPFIYVGLYEKNNMDFISYHKSKKKNSIKYVFKTSYKYGGDEK